MIVTFISLSRDETKFEELCCNLKQILPSTSQYQILAIDGNTQDIPTGYNRGVLESGLASHPEAVFVFVHDDVRLMCNFDLLQQALDLTVKDGTGVVGVAGTTLLNENGCWWFNSPDCRGSVYHSNEEKTILHQNVWPGPGHAFYGEVVALDGLFLCCSAATFEKIGGFRTNLPGFHFYDIDFSLRSHLMGLKNFVVPLPIYHGSIGRLSGDWEAARRDFVQTYSSVLPRGI